MSKKLVVCADGTWNWPDQDAPTNVIKTVRALADTDAAGRAQVVFYDPGVGTSGSKLQRYLDGALGLGLSDNVQDGYRFLANNYAPDDEIFLFGFSRGAYTVRSLAGLIGRVGLLHKGDMEHFPAAYALYRMPRKSRDAAGREDTAKSGRLEAAYRAAEARFVARLPTMSTQAGVTRDRRRFPLITFIGVWDTVGSLGIPAGDIPVLRRFQPTFHDTELNCFVENAYQALALDEKRRTFEPAIWEKREHAIEPEGDRPWVPPDRQRVEQVWFAGVHSNIGGGYPDSGLADIAWAWMLGRARRHGLAFDEAYVAERMARPNRRKLEDSWAGLPWRLLGRKPRTPLRKPRSDEKLHPTVEERWLAQAAHGVPPFEPHPYRPAVLADLGEPPSERWEKLRDSSHP